MTGTRIVALLALADEAPEPDELLDYLADPDPDVRRTALTVLSEVTEDWAQGSTRVADALLDPDPTVRSTAIELLAELREVLVADQEFTAVLHRAGTHPDAAVRAAAIGNLWRHHSAGADDARRYLLDPDPGVRAEAVLAAVSLHATEPLTTSASDPAPEVRIAVAKGLGTIGDPCGAGTLSTLATDPEPAVSTAAFTALADTGCPPDAAALAVEALHHPSWRIREAAATALAAAAHELATAPLITALTDSNLDVRKAAVRALDRLAPDHADVPASLTAATEDPDADVRAYARQALRHYSHPSER